MVNDALLVGHPLLGLCAVLRWFDRDLLLNLEPDSIDSITTLFLSDHVIRHPSAMTYQLHADVRVAVLNHVRTEQPLAEFTLRTRVFTHFLQRLEADLVEPQVDDCLYYLGELFPLLTARREWSMITRYVEILRAIGLCYNAHQHQLLFYEGFVLIHNQDFARGEPILQHLLLQNELASDLRMQVHNALGLTHWYHSRYDQAISAYQHVYDLAITLESSLYQGYALLNMGMVYSEIGRYARALDLSTQSLQVFRQSGNRGGAAHAGYEIGNSAMQLGRWEEAQFHFKQAIQFYEASDTQSHLANLYSCQGFLNHMLGDEVQSEVAYLRGLAIAQSSNNGDAALTTDTLLYLGFLYQTQERWEEALSVYAQAREFAERMHNHHVLALIQYRRGDVFRRKGSFTHAFLAYQEAISTIESLRIVNETEEIKISLLGTVQHVYETMVLFCLQQERLDDAFNYVERARSRAFLDLLMKKAPELYDAVDQPVATLNEVQARLAEGELLIEYFVTGVVPYGEHLLNQIPKEHVHLREHLIIPPRIMIFALTRDQCIVREANLDPNKLRPLPNDPLPGQQLVRERMLVSLYNHLIAPVSQLVHRCELMYLVPHGPLHYVPFMALRAADQTYLLDAKGPAIAFAPSATILLRNCLRRPIGRSIPMLALGYNGSGTHALQYAEAEALAVAQLMGGKAWIGPMAKSAQLMTEGKHARWLHVSGHATYNMHDPLDSQLQLGENDTVSARTIIRDLDLRADLVMLSACTSGLSQVVPGDELFGLQRAFLYAGAAAIVCTLWDAKDLVALLIVERFYQALLQGHGGAYALRDALVAVRSMTGADLAATIRRWRIDYPDHADVLTDVYTHALQQHEALLYADPLHWATFMLIGRAT